MNHCGNCNSSYERPGTCNCFAPILRPAFILSPPIYYPAVPPWSPWQPVMPWQQTPYPTWPNSPFWSIAIAGSNEGTLYNTSETTVAQALLGAANSGGM